MTIFSWYKKYAPKAFQRSILVFLSLILTFGLFEFALSKWVSMQPRSLDYSHNIPINSKTSTEEAASPIIGDRGVEQEQPKLDVKRAKLREDDSLRTINTKTFVNTDGTKTLEYSAYPKHYSKNGRLENLNPTISADLSYKKTSNNSSRSVVSLASTSQPQAFNLSTGDMESNLRPF